MHRLNSEYWDKFKKMNKQGELVGDGLAFENLIEALLKAKYGISWNSTLKSHDNNRDFWLLLENEHLWAECKNYQDTIAMNVLAPTLVMAQIYQVNTILFFSRSQINRSAKEKILAYGEKSGKKILFYDGVCLEDLIWTYRDDLPERYRPSLHYLQEDKPAAFAKIYFQQDAVPGIYTASDTIKKYENADIIHYNKNFALVFIVLNPFPSNQVQISIKFSHPNKNRYYYEYLSDRISPEKDDFIQFVLENGEGRSVSLNIRQIKYIRELALPGFEIEACESESGKILRWCSPQKMVRSKWIGKAALIGNYYHDILSQTNERLVHNSVFSSLVITGSSGTGKTRMLAECQNIFLKHGYQIISFIAQDDFSSAGFFKEIISFLYEIPGEEVLELLEEKLSSQEVSDKSETSQKSELAFQLLKLIYQNTSEEALERVVDQYGSILCEKMAQQKNVLMIDNLQFTGTAFQKFVRQYFYYSVNRQEGSGSVVICVFNLDYMTKDSSELLFHLLHAGVRYFLHKNINGFENINQGVLFLRELIRVSGDEDQDFFYEIVKRVSLNPYNLYQTVNYLEENEIIRITPEETGYIISNLKKYKVLQEISGGITAVLDKRFEFLDQKIQSSLLHLICSILYVFDRLDEALRGLFEISESTLQYLQKRHILRQPITGTYVFDHDIIRNYFSSNYEEHITDCLYWLHGHVKDIVWKRYYVPFRLYQIAILKDPSAILEASCSIPNAGIPERMASVFYDYLFDGHMKLLEYGTYRGIHIKYIHQICACIRQYKGSQKALEYCKTAFETIQAYVPQAISSDMVYYRPFIHFYCDIAVELHLQEQTECLVQSVIQICENADPRDEENRDEIYVLEAIMYNRHYVSLNINFPTREVTVKRRALMANSRKFITNIKNPVKKGLIEYLNNSDEGYNYYGYIRDLNRLIAIWDKCIIDIPRLVPEKTLNYYRKKAQYYLIYQQYEALLNVIDEALLYLEQGEYSHEPIIFRTFFSMAEIMGHIQNDPHEKNYYYNRKVIDDILQMQQLLNNHKLGDILLLKGVNAFYAGDKNEVYYSFKTAYEYYSQKDTSRYWIKMDLLKENIRYAFTTLHLYEEKYDFNCFPDECRAPMPAALLYSHRASGTQQTGDCCLNLPLI